jgi:hypothetical protein
MRKMRFAVLTCTTIALVTGCGASGQTSRGAAAGTSNQQASEATLRQGVRTALAANHRLAIYVLWHNSLPHWASSSTRGPALSSLRQAGAAREKRGVRVRLSRDEYRVLSIRLDPSYTKAMAVARGTQRVRPYGLSGKPLGQTVLLDERARIELHRVGSSTRFVVWKVALIR